MVKLDDKALAKEVGVFALPSIVFFRVNSEPTIYAGDLKNEEAILEWLLVQKDPSNEAIEEQSGENLLKTIDNTEAVAVFICKFQIFISVRYIHIFLMLSREINFNIQLSSSCQRLITSVSKKPWTNYSTVDLKTKKCPFEITDLQ